MLALSSRYILEKKFAERIVTKSLNHKRFQNIFIFQGLIMKKIYCPKIDKKELSHWKVIFLCAKYNFSYTQLIYAFVRQKDFHYVHDDSDVFFFLFLRKALISFACFFLMLFFVFLVIVIYHFYMQKKKFYKINFF